jgi:hypothetical protein
LARRLLIEMGMKLLRALLLVVCTTSISACCAGWDIAGEVSTKAVTNKNRPLHVYMVNTTAIDLAKTALADLPTWELTHADEVPSYQIAFEYSRLGCHAGAVMVVAWAPAHKPAASTPLSGPDSPGHPFKPQPGDLVTASTVRDPYCGYEAHVEGFELVLDDTQVVK